MALSNCRSNGRGLRLRYRLEIFGYANDDLCARSSASSTVFDASSSSSSSVSLILDFLRRLRSLCTDADSVVGRDVVGHPQPLSGCPPVRRLQPTLHLLPDAIAIGRRTWRSLGVAVVAVAVIASHAAGSILL
jgi:hypothetical protein